MRERVCVCEKVCVTVRVCARERLRERERMCVREGGARNLCLALEHLRLLGSRHLPHGESQPSHKTVNLLFRSTLPQNCQLIVYYH